LTLVGHSLGAGLVLAVGSSCVGLFAALTAWLVEPTAGNAEPRTIAALVNNAGANGGAPTKFPRTLKSPQLT
jgi:hypothetical protein